MATSQHAFAWIFIFCATAAPAATPDSDLTGRWEVTTTYPGGTYISGLELTSSGTSYVGRSGYLVHDGPFPYKYSGTLQHDGLHLQILPPGGTKPFGSLVINEENGMLQGTGELYGVPIVIRARRPAHAPDAPRVITYEPKVFYSAYSGANAPALHIFSGDTVRTKTLDANGHDEHDVAAAVNGNPLTGPFYIEGAMVGDTIAVHFDKIRPNRNTAFQSRSSIASIAVPPGYEQKRPQNWSNIWLIDRSNGTARPDKPSEKLKGYQVRLAPMLGSIGTAPIGNAIYDSAELGRFGGNLDYNQIREGTTLYLPVYQAGALLVMGDGHALQADGEITGQGLETSMDIEFTVRLIKDELLDQPWAENDQYVMVSGIGGSLQAAQQNATSGLSNWLISHFRLDTGEVATVLATSIHYDIAEIVDPQVHVVAKLSKDVLAQLPQQPQPKAVICSGSCVFE